jgi:hypothetical protein
MTNLAKASAEAGSQLALPAKRFAVG